MIFIHGVYTELIGKKKCKKRHIEEKRRRKKYTE